MPKKTYIVLILISSVFIAGIGAFIGYSFLKPMETLETPNIQSYANINSDILDNQNDKEIQGNSQLIEAAETIDVSTDMVYEYYYTKDGKIESSIEKPPYFLQGLSEASLKEKLSGWEISEFSKERVVLRKTIEQKSPDYYVVGVKDGYVAVFQHAAADNNVLKEQTDIPISLLPEEEQQRLKNGIPVANETQLLKVLEDYTS